MIAHWKTVAPRPFQLSLTSGLGGSLIRRVLDTPCAYEMHSKRLAYMGVNLAASLIIMSGIIKSAVEYYAVDVCITIVLCFSSWPNDAMTTMARWR